MKLKDQQHAQIIDLFQESEYTGKFLKENIESIVGELSKQFREPEDCYREVIQNNIDAETPQIDIYLDSEKINKTKSKFTVTFEDYGIGMNFNDRKKFFLKLFASSKEHNPKKIGQYGIGISSIFALNLKEVNVESSGKSADGVESWGLHIKDIDELPSYRHYDIAERKGTKISLTKIVNTKDIAQHKAKVKEKVAFYCERSRTPIYIEKEFINKEFDLDSMIKISQNRDGLEYILSVGEKEPHFEIFNNRLKLQDGKSLFSDCGTDRMVSCLISSPYFKHTFSRDSVVKNDTFKSVMDEVRRAIGGLFVKSLEVIEHYNNTSLPEFNFKKPFVEVIYFDGGIKIVYDDFSMRNIKSDIKLAKKYPEMKMFMENLDKVEKKIITLKEKQATYLRKLNEYNRLIEKRNREFATAWEFVNLWLKDTIEKVEKKRKEGGIASFFKPSDFYGHLRRALPLAASKYKVIQTLSGEFSINEILDVLKNEGRLYYVSSRDSKLKELLKKDEKMVFYDSPRSLISGQKETILTLASKNNKENPYNRYIDANHIYSVGLRIDKNKVDERAQFFLEIIKRQLPVKLKAKMSDIYFTNNLRLDYMGGPIIFRSDSGKIEIGREKKFSKRVKEKFMDVVYQKPYDVALNLDNKIIQNMISLICSGHELSKGVALDTIIRMISEKFPAPVRYTDYNPAGRFVWANYKNNYKGLKSWR